LVVATSASVSSLVRDCACKWLERLNQKATAAIRRFLVPKYGYGPSLVAGDSSGDENTMQDFPDTRPILIMNLLQDPRSDIGRLSRQAVDRYGPPDARVLLQGRDDNLGQLLPSQASCRFGSHTARKLP
jgi:hypothetical protein